MAVESLQRLIAIPFRKRRMNKFEHEFYVETTTRVLDLGGTETIWGFAKVRPRLTLLNITLPKEMTSPNWIIADARCLPFQDNSFDIVFSNSLVEHLGTFEDQRAFARAVWRVSPRYYVQTPNRRFPFEPHLLTPLIHYFPKPVQRRLLRSFTVWGLLTRPAPEACQGRLEEIRLLDCTELNCPFPDAEIWPERVLGLTKSLVAVKTR